MACSFVQVRGCGGNSLPLSLLPTRSLLAPHPLAHAAAILLPIFGSASDKHAPLLEQVQLLLTHYPCAVIMVGVYILCKQDTQALRQLEVDMQVESCSSACVLIAAMLQLLRCHASAAVLPYFSCCAAMLPASAAARMLCGSVAMLPLSFAMHCHAAA